jgi:hypothetical protein
VKPESFDKWDDEYNYWLQRLIELNFQKLHGAKPPEETEGSSGTTKELDWQIRQAFHNVKLLILLRYPIQVTHFPHLKENGIIIKAGNSKSVNAI